MIHRSPTVPLKLVEDEAAVGAVGAEAGADAGSEMAAAVRDAAALGDCLICFSHLRWNFVFQRPQHLMSRFARALPVFFWEEPVPVWEAPSVDAADVPRLDVASDPSGVVVLRPVLPEGVEGAEATRMQARLLKAFLRSRRIRRPVMWFYSPFLLGIAAGAPAALTVYDCMDELSAFRFAPPDLRRRETRMMRRAEIVFTGGHALHEAKRHLHHDIHAVPSSVDFSHFLPARAARPDPADQAPIPHPRLGFYGVLDERLDQTLLSRLAEARPDWHLVLIGPVVKIDPAGLPRARNIHYLGMKPYAELPAYVAGWDAALMPFVCDASTRLISPTKTPEYLAAGRPVVCTPIRDVVRGYGDLAGVRIAQGADAFAAAAEEALGLAARPGDWLPEVDRRLAETSWERTWAFMVERMRAAQARGGGAAAAPILAAPVLAGPILAGPLRPRQATPAARKDFGPSPFASFFMGGFEGSSHRRGDGRRLDMIAQTGHDANAEADYRLLTRHGLGTARDALRWHLIERPDGSYDWSSFLPMLRAARDARLQVIWDLCHYGVPAHLDIWSDAFVERFAAFAAAAARLVRDETDGPAFWCPVNEISFWTWAGGSRGKMYPAARRRGPALKRQLVRASIAATRAVRAVDPKARFVQAEPLINVLAADRAQVRQHAAAHQSQYEASDMLIGAQAPELGGGADCLDILGANFYWNNQWVAGGDPVPLGHRLHRPLRDMLAELHQRYDRPVLISETGAEGRSGPAWLRYVAAEARAAQRAGVPVLGVCVYPVMDYPGWENGRHCRCGLIETDARWKARSVNAEMLDQLREEQALAAPPAEADAAD